MSSSVAEMDAQAPTAAWCDDAHLHVRMMDGREIATPLWWYPSLMNASPEQRNRVELMFSGIHWPELDEDLSIEGMLKGWKARDAVPPAEAAE